MNKEETRGRKMRSDNVRFIPEFRDHINIDEICKAMIQLKISISKEKECKQNKEN